MSRAALSAVIRVRHGYKVTIELTAEPPPGEPLDSQAVVYEMHAAGHRVAAELWALAGQRGARWAIDVSYARVALELTEAESAHEAAVAAQAACRAAGVLGPASAARPPAKAQRGRAKAWQPPAPKRRARG